MAQMVLDLFKETLENVLGDSEIKKGLLDDFHSRLKDTGLDVHINNWRDCFYEKRVPKPMTATTVHIQIKNLEEEVIRLRSNAYSDGFDRKARTLDQFDLEQNKYGRTVLVPRTQLTQIILANSKNQNFQLSGVPCEQFEKLCFEIEERKRHNEVLSSEIARLKTILDGQESAVSEIKALQSVLNAERIHKMQIAYQRDEAQCLLAGLCHRFGLQCEIDNSRGAVSMPDIKGRRKGRKNRRIPIVQYTFGDFSSDSDSSSGVSSPQSAYCDQPSTNSTFNSATPN
nr:NSP3 [Bat RVJ-like rotavirus BtSY2]